ncbi:chemotaxis protein CheB [Pirellulaceae bacterium SH449]
MLEETNSDADPFFYVVGIGASAGGLEALERFFQSTPPDTGMAFIVVQHLSPDFKSLMGEVLSRWTDMPIRTAVDQMPIAPNTVFLMPSNTEMIISNGKLLLTARERTEELRLPIDQFLRSLARDFGPRSVGIILSGTGSDGSRGIRDIHQAGGCVLVQSPSTAKFDGMPCSAIDTDVASAILPPDEMPFALLRHINHPKAEAAVESETRAMEPLFHLLRNGYGIDFSYYKPSTVNRRTQHRMQLSKVPDLDEYFALVKNDRAELDALYRDLLVGVTSFFRDPQAFSILENRVFPDLLAKHGDLQEVRLWVAGCATGEEAYSMAILLDEALRKSGRRIQAKVFATDVHSKSIEFAAAGVYPADSLTSMSEQRKQQYFVPIKDQYRVTSELRNLVVFAQHNITKDAPFTHMDLISCRNLLIYLLPPAQNKALSLFHFGLKTGGVLMLGPSENVGELASEFESIDNHWKLYTKRRDVRLPTELRFPVSSGTYTRNAATSSHRDSQTTDVFLQTLETTLDSAVLVNSNREIVHSFGNSSEFLRWKSGTPSLDLLEMLQDELRMAVGAALHRATKEKSAVTLNNVRVLQSREERFVNIIVTPIPATRRITAHTLIQFAEAANPIAPTKSLAKDLDINEAAQDHILGLEAELRFTRETLQATIEELETSNEELQATNEELLASNEELQSTNEELHSVNEELYTVNAEYQHKIEELTELTHDMNNLLSSTDVHTIFLDENLAIRRFTPKMADLFHLIDSDLGRSIHSFTHSIRCENLSHKLQEVLENRTQVEQEVESSEGDVFLMRILPYKGDPDQGGVVLTLIDITKVRDAETRFSNAMEVSPNGMLMVCNRGLITQVNTELARIFGYQIHELIGKPLESLLPDKHRNDHQVWRQQYFRNPYILRRMGALPYVWAKHRSGELIPVDVHVRPISTPSGRQAIASVVDVSKHQQLEESLRTQVQQRDRFLATLSHELRNPMGALMAASALIDQAAPSPETLRTSSEVIRRKSMQMALLLDDLLDVARVTQGKINLRLEPVDLCSVCRDTLEAVEPLLTEHRHSLQTEIPVAPVWIEADKVRIGQILENLLTNAIKYTDDGGRIGLALATTESSVTVEVNDNGRGMSAEFIESIFDMFVQSDETLDRREGGMGVGLTLVQGLVEMHGGTIFAQSEGVGLGSRFTISLPVTDKRPSCDEPLPAPATNKSKRIVYIEDDSDTRSVFAVLLERYGHHVIGVAGDGVQGYEMIRSSRPEAVILDIGLPGMDGYQLAKKVRQELGDSIYLIALTGYGRNEDHQSVLEAGFNCHLVKPVMIDQLDQVLGSIPD